MHLLILIYILLSAEVAVRWWLVVQWWLRYVRDQSTLQFSKIAVWSTSSQLKRMWVFERNKFKINTHVYSTNSSKNFAERSKPGWRPVWRMETPLATLWVAVICTVHMYRNRRGKFHFCCVQTRFVFTLALVVCIFHLHSGLKPLVTRPSNYCIQIWPYYCLLWGGGCYDESVRLID